LSFLLAKPGQERFAHALQAPIQRA